MRGQNSFWNSLSDPFAYRNRFGPVVVVVISLPMVNVNLSRDAIVHCFCFHSRLYV